MVTIVEEVVLTESKSPIRVAVDTIPAAEWLDLINLIRRLSWGAISTTELLDKPGMLKVIVNDGIVDEDPGVVRVTIPVLARAFTALIENHDNLIGRADHPNFLEVYYGRREGEVLNLLDIDEEMMDYIVQVAVFGQIHHS